MTSMPPLLSRVNFNFTKRCNLACEFCYIPFDGIDSDLLLWQRIVEKCKTWRPLNITFGGGDPFMYRDFPLLLESTSDNRIFIQVDTNALSLRDRDLSIIRKCVQLLGLPIDGTEEVHSAMRSSRSHFEVVNKWLKRITEEQVVPVKINTVVSKINVHDLDRLAQHLSAYPIRLWSLYQFWPLALGKHNLQHFEIPTAEFLDVTSRIKEKYASMRIEVSAVSDRLFSYLFVAQTGNVYVVDKNNPREYIDLGSVFDEDILAKWQAHGDYVAVNARAELRFNV